MRPRLFFLAAMAAASLLLFGYVLRQLSFISVGLAANREVEPLLRQSLEDQKKLAKLEPQHAAEHRERFDSLRTMIAYLDILALTRRDITRRIELVLFAVVAFIVLAGVASYLVEQRSRERRLARLGVALDALSRGDSDITTNERGRDLIGRIAGMIEETSRVMTRDRRRVRTLENLESWQEAARRHAHEIRTPLTAAQLEVRSLIATLSKQHPEDAERLGAAEASILEELEQLRRFTSNFSSFATIGQPRLQPQDVAAFVDDFAAKFAPSWPALTIAMVPPAGDCRANIDRDMIRRVLVNLCSNSAAAGSTRIAISVRREGDAVHVVVADDGEGISPKVRARLFEPYTTTRQIGEGMGLGLAISRKILLDHGGDLEAIDAARGATFRLTLPALERGA